MNERESEWGKLVKLMTQWLDENLCESRVLEGLSRYIGYSPWYLSTMFHTVTGQTLKSYVQLRRLSHIADELTNSRERVLDIAVKYGYSSQEAVTRAFKERYGLTPAEYRKSSAKRDLSADEPLISLDNDTERMIIMKQERLNTRIEHIPAHKYMGIWEENAKDHGEFFRLHNGDDVCSVITEMESVSHNIVTAHTAGWTWKNGKRCYFYGMGLPADYSGEIPDGFSVREFPASDYMVFSYPAFDFAAENGDVMSAVENLAFGFDPRQSGYEWNEAECQDYQRHYPEKLGYEVLRPIKRID